MWATAAMAGAAVCAPAAHAATSDVTCGETITQSVTLTANLDCSTPSTSPGLVIGAAGITVNLNRHHISDVFGSPVILDDGYDSVTIENGGVDSSADCGGIDLENASDVDILGVGLITDCGSLSISGGHGDLIQDSGFPSREPVVVTDADDVKFFRDSFTTNVGESALILDNVNASSVTGSTLAPGGYPAPDGLSLTGSDDLIADNHTGNIELDGGTQDVIDDNEDPTAGGFVIFVDAPATETRVRGNMLSGGGLTVFGSKARITDNSLGPGPDSLFYITGPDARIIGNTLDHAAGIGVSGPGARITDNTVDDSYHNDGINVSGPGARIIGNTADGDPENGIEVTDPTAHINGNTTEDNTLFGITATPGDTGHGNVASGNNTVNGVTGRQCLNISCMAPTS